MVSILTMGSAVVGEARLDDESEPDSERRRTPFDDDAEAATLPWSLSLLGLEADEGMRLSLGRRSYWGCEGDVEMVWW